MVGSRDMSQERHVDSKTILSKTLILHCSAMDHISVHKHNIS